MEYLKRFLLVLAVPLAMMSCGKTEMKTITSSEIELLEEYPMEGANTVTGIWNVDLGDIDAAKIKKARLASITFTTVNPENSDGIQEMTIQLAASGAAMQKVAVLNPVPQNVTQLSPSVASEQGNLADLMRQKEITLVADVNLAEELEGELLLKAVMNFEIEVKQ
jgi:hypothetical protein